MAITGGNGKETRRHMAVLCRLLLPQHHGQAGPIPAAQTATTYEQDQECQNLHQTGSGKGILADPIAQGSCVDHNVFYRVRDVPMESSADGVHERVIDPAEGVGRTIQRD